VNRVDSRPAWPGLIERYRDRLPRWVAGELDTLVDPRTPGELAPGRVASTILLRHVP